MNEAMTVYKYTKVIGESAYYAFKAAMALLYELMKKKEISKHYDSLADYIDKINKNPNAADAPLLCKYDINHKEERDTLARRLKEAGVEGVSFDKSPIEISIKPHTADKFVVKYNLIKAGNIDTETKVDEILQKYCSEIEPKSEDGHYKSCVVKLKDKSQLTNLQNDVKEYIDSELAAWFVINREHEVELDVALKGFSSRKIQDLNEQKKVAQISGMSYLQLPASEVSYAYRYLLNYSSHGLDLRFTSKPTDKTAIATSMCPIEDLADIEKTIKKYAVSDKSIRVSDIGNGQARIIFEIANDKKSAIVKALDKYIYDDVFVQRVYDVENNRYGVLVPKNNTTDKILAKLADEIDNKRHKNYSDEMLRKQEKRSVGEVKVLEKQLSAAANSDVGKYFVDPRNQDRIFFVSKNKIEEYDLNLIQQKGANENVVLLKKTIENGMGEMYRIQLSELKEGKFIAMSKEDFKEQLSIMETARDRAEKHIKEMVSSKEFCVLTLSAEDDSMLIFSPEHKTIELRQKGQISMYFDSDSILSNEIALNHIVSNVTAKGDCELFTGYRANKYFEYLNRKNNIPKEWENAKNLDMGLFVMSQSMAKPQSRVLHYTREGDLEIYEMKYKRQDGVWKWCDSLKSSSKYTIKNCSFERFQDEVNKLKGNIITQRDEPRIDENGEINYKLGTRREIINTIKNDITKNEMYITREEDLSPFLKSKLNFSKAIIKESDTRNDVLSERSKSVYAALQTEIERTPDLFNQVTEEIENNEKLNKLFLNNYTPHGDELMKNDDFLKWLSTKPLWKNFREKLKKEYNIPDSDFDVICTEQFVSRLSGKVNMDRSLKAARSERMTVFDNDENGFINYKDLDALFNKEEKPNIFERVLR